MSVPQWLTSLLKESPELAAEDAEGQDTRRRLTPHREEEQSLIIWLGDLGQAFATHIARISPGQRQCFLSP
ncbi:hypothetical protein SAMN05428945_4611 [Streptomyces sp. 2224.1]|nr:hypothetical protein BX261_0727 [Streptomyces sp. 2321.6]SDR57003.1 hypothetical protein SAMN05216511_6493 [Streptomyces sp. KS_16]SEB92327.1 hypothetical protein SAMN05428940_0726 [Streptomyces sp. 2133.1]SED34088.1 hypothetical protein SAMN05428945_4611 [Streptomyces sp. 2224.1]SEF12179.1 hypothetical protein SAMN05428954_6548 [Streptomyces sp. 2112.3]SNC62614.1 hypothetical protein SAMN06272741_0725 [Streptomyces sp. 2114.4]